MLIKNITNRNQRYEGKRICAYWCIDSLECVPVSICVRIRVHKRMSAWITDPRAQALRSDFMQSWDIRIATLRW